MKLKNITYLKFSYTLDKYYIKLYINWADINKKLH